MFVNWWSYCLTNKRMLKISLLIIFLFSWIRKTTKSVGNIHMKVWLRSTSTQQYLRTPMHIVYPCGSRLQRRADSCASIRCRKGQITLELVEALGIKEALSWTKYNHKQPAIVETDCLSMVQAIRCSLVYLSNLGRVTKECKSLVSE